MTELDLLSTLKNVKIRSHSSIPNVALVIERGEALLAFVATDSLRHSHKPRNTKPSIMVMSEIQDSLHPNYKVQTQNPRDSIQ